MCGFVKQKRKRVLKILYENKHLVVVVKPVGVLSEEDGNKQSVPLLLKRYYIEKGMKNPKIFTVHRLDRDVGGVMVLAKDAKTAGTLSAAVSGRQIGKEYLAVLHGVPKEAEGCLEDLLFRDARTGKSYIADGERKGVRDARLEYRLLGTAAGDHGEPLSLVRIRLHTGRTHQIRVQFASRKLPLYGDGRYGSGDGGSKPALFSCHLLLEGQFDCSAKPDTYPFTLFGELF